MANLRIIDSSNRLVISDDGFKANLLVPITNIKILSVGTQGAAGADADLHLELPTMDGEVSGFSTNEFQAGYATTEGDLVYLENNTEWNKCDANDVTKCSGLLGIIMEAKNIGEQVLVALPGSFVSSAGFPSLTIGGPIYIGENEGEISMSYPVVTNSVIRVIGWAIASDKIYFYPSPDFITHV